MYLRRGVTCKYFGGYETRTRVGHVMEFGEGSKFEADVMCVLIVVPVPVAKYIK